MIYTLSTFLYLLIIWQQCLFKFAIKCPMTLPGRASQGKYLIIYDNWCSDDLVHIHILFQFRLKLRTYIYHSQSQCILKKYVQILGNTMKMALYACKAKFWKKTTWLKKTIQILNYHCSISSNLVHCVMCINLEICKNEL